MKKQSFTLTTFLASAIFLIHEILKTDQKMAGAKKVITIESQFFHTRQSREEIF